MRRVTSHRKDSFEYFYLTKVALGDCCDCAERVIDWRDIENASRAHKRHCNALSEPVLSEPVLPEPALSEPVPSPVSRLAKFLKVTIIKSKLRKAHR